MKGFTQVSRQAAAEVDLLDPLNSFVKEKADEPSLSSSRKSSSIFSDSILSEYQIISETSTKDIVFKSSTITSENEFAEKGVQKEKRPETTSSDILKNLKFGSISPRRVSSQSDSANLGNKNNYNSPMRGKMIVTNEESKSLPATNSSTDTDDFSYLSGEGRILDKIGVVAHVIPVGEINGTLFMTNYRLIVIPNENDLRRIKSVNISFLSWLHIPVASIDRLERENRRLDSYNSGIYVVIHCKDCRQLRLHIKSNTSKNGDYEAERALNLIQSYAFPTTPNPVAVSNTLRYLFAFCHNIGRHPLPTLRDEYLRMGLGSHSTWVISNANNKYQLCATYPKELVIPAAIRDEQLFSTANFRSEARIPILSWTHPRYKGTLWRSSQPKIGIANSANAADVYYLECIARSVSERVLKIVDCRSKNSAMANFARGGGTEYSTTYPSSQIEFYNIPNIHSVRESYRNMMSIVLNPTANMATDITFSKQIDDTQWLTNIRLILRASYETVCFIHRGFPVLVHCTHGWDRTAQVTSIAQLFLDPYYRTLEGFPVLIEKEWNSFGHQFQIRCAHATKQNSEFAPIFLQFLDCLYQIMRSFREFFEFNGKYLLTIADHIYSGRFGTFIFNCDIDRVSYF
jgi:hypothetical protein